MNLYTIGFLGKSAEQFFELLMENKVKRVIDIRLHNKSQLAGFAKQKDLEYFLKTIARIDYAYMPIFAPTQELLDKWRRNKIWEEYERGYLKLLKEKSVLKDIDLSLFEDACLLCSEPTPENCHRRLLAEYLAGFINGIKIFHV